MTSLDIIEENAAQKPLSAHNVKIKNARILVVDDSDLIRELIGACLMTDGYYNICYAENGRDALEVIDLETPDLIILDLEMPVMDGFELTKELRSRSDTAAVPILIQSGRDTAADITRAFEYGASDMVVKPIKKFEILARAKVHLEHRFLVEKLTDFHDRVATELEQARKLQLDICPSEEELSSFSSLYGINVGWHYEPSSELGGDIGGIYPIDETNIAFYIADFSGHGVAAALNTFRMQSWLASSAKLYKSPDKLLFHLNNFLNKNLSRGSYATMLFGCVNITENTLSYASAGTQPPLILNKDTKECFELRSSHGMPLGLREGWTYDVKSEPFNQGSKLVLYSDALVEVEHMPGKFLGDDGLLQEVNEIWSSEDLADKDRLPELIRRFHIRAGSTADDDLTIICLEHLGLSDD